MTQKHNEIRDSFFLECEDLLEALEDGFRRMSEDTGDTETLHAVFRAVHSIKGGAGAFGLDALVDFAHGFETLLDVMRSGGLEPDEDLFRLFHRAGDHLADLVAASRDGQVHDPELSARLQAEFVEVVGETAIEVEPIPAFEPRGLDLALPANASTPSCYRISFEALPELYRSGNDPALLFRALARLGDLKVEVATDALPAFTEIDWQQSYLSWVLHLETHESMSAVLEVFEFVEGMCWLDVARGEADDPAAETPAPEPRAAAGSADALFVAALPATATTDGAAGSPFGVPAAPPAVATATPPADDVQVVPHPPTAAAPLAARKSGDSGGRPSGATIRVDLERVDRLINLVGELVIKEAMLSQSIAQAELSTESDVYVDLDGLKQLAGDIQEGVMAIRAQPVKSMFQRMFRIVREAGDATGKRVRLVTQGDQTEVDKTVIERLVDPLTHMIRNAVDHGLEDAEVRRAAGKSEEGTVVLSAAHRSGRVMIDISDDGGGIDRPKVRRLAEAKGLIQPGAELSAADIDSLLFLPGFSSKEEVSNLSGRGVGLDVARSEIQALGGRVSITSSPGEGTTFSISLPLTLAVLEGMVIEVGGQTMVVPITAIQETLQPTSAGIHPLGNGGRVVENRNELVPIIDLGNAFGFRAALERLDGHVLLLVETDSNRRCALVVDGIQDQRQVVIKSLEDNFGHVDGVAAATILGDGRIALIIDPDEIVAAASGPAAADFHFAATG